MSKETPTQETLSHTPIVVGSNEAADLIGRYAETIAQHLDEIDDTREFVKAAKQEAKAQGLDMTALNLVVKAKRASSQTARIEQEMINRTYLRVAGFQVAD